MEGPAGGVGDGDPVGLGRRAVAGRRGEADPRPRGPGAPFRCRYGRKGSRSSAAKRSYFRACRILLSEEVVASPLCETLAWASAAVAIPTGPRRDEGVR